MSENAIQLNWENAGQLLTLLVEFKARKDAGDAIDLKDAASKVGQALGIENVDEFAQKAISESLGSGFGDVFVDEQAKELVAIFAGMCKPAMSLVAQYAQGEINPPQLFGSLDKLCLENTEGLQTVLQQSLGIPDESANLLADKLGPYTISVYCFAAAFKIYQKAANDAALAKERRIEIERMADEAIALLRDQRSEMEALVNGYLLDRLEPFAAGVAAMDEAVLACDDDGYIAANAQLWDLFGRNAQYRSADEFDDLMLSEETFKL